MNAGYEDGETWAEGIADHKRSYTEEVLQSGINSKASAYGPYASDCCHRKKGKSSPSLSTCALHSGNVKRSLMNRHDRSARPWTLYHSAFAAVYTEACAVMK